MVDMPRPRKPYVQRERTRHGKCVWYFRRGEGPRSRLRGDYESPEWLADYEAALSGQPRATPVSATAGTLRWLVARYYDSTAFVNLKPATQRQRKSVLNRVVAGDGGDWKLGQVTTKRIVEGRDARSATPAAAVDFVKAMRGMFKWALEAQHVLSDPTAGIVAADPKTDGHHTWTVEEVRQFQNRFALGTRPRLAMDLMLYTGMRVSDAIVAGRQHVRNGVLSYRSIKTGEFVDAPVLAPLAKSLAAADATGRMTFLVTENGTAFTSVNSFGNWFRKQCIEAGVPGRSHGLRKAGATFAAEHGASDRELMALFGWKDAKQAGVYTRKASRAKLAMGAASKLFMDEEETSIPAPSTGVRG